VAVDRDRPLLSDAEGLFIAIPPERLGITRPLRRGASQK
jgi:hypothetical protein